jgi:hypothetical protein
MTEPNKCQKCGGNIVITSCFWIKYCEICGGDGSLNKDKSKEYL